MHCPFCGADDTKVIDSRLASEGQQVRRRRECIECSERFTTFELAELNMPRIIKTNGAREPFMEEKLRAGLMRALEKRPVATDLIEDSIENIRHQLLAGGEREVDSRRLGELVMTELRKLDHVAYIRFASVYMSFDDIESFREVVNRLENDKPTQAEHDQQTAPSET